MKKLFLLLLAVLAMAVCASAQTRTVTGTVVDAAAGEAEPLVGASVSAGHGVGVVTDVDGNFSIQVAANTTHLTISYVGYTPQTVKIGNGPMLVRLEPETTVLNEVIAVAYGTVKRSEYTGSAGVVAADQLENAQVSNVTKALSGKMAGVQTLSNNGQPGTSATVYVRGVGSINASTAPLYVVDGMPYDGDISNLAASDIEQLTVMKDAASTALYGARGANGVIIITTKRGSEGNAKVTLDASWGSNGRSLPTYDIVKSPGQYLELLYNSMYMQQRGAGASPAAANAYANNNLWLGAMQTMSVPAGESFIGMNGKLNPNATPGYSDGVYLYTPDSWIDNTFRSGLRQEYGLTVTGGTQKLNYYVSGSYLNDEGILEGSHFKRFSSRVSVDYQAKPWLKISTTTSYVYTDSGYPDGQTSADDNYSGNAFAVAYQMAPIYPIFARAADGTILRDKANGSPIYDYGMGQDFGLGAKMMARPSGAWATANPAGSLIYDKTSYLTDVLDTKWSAILTPLEGLTISGTAGLYIDNTRYHSYNNNLYGQLVSVGGSITQEAARYNTLNLQALASYNRTFNDIHDFDIMLGAESQDYAYEWVDGSGAYIYMPGNWFLSNTINSWTVGGGRRELVHRSFFGRLKYNLNNRYYFTASVRSDASSRFHPDHRWGTFWSASFGWDINKENFLKDKTWIDILKFKASFGQNGNDNISTQYINYTDFYSISGANSVWSDSELAYKGNPDITWEKSNNFNTGFDFSFWHGKLSGTAEYYMRQTSDMLFNLPVAPSLGYSSIPANVGSMRNSGFELTLNYRVFQTKDMNLELFANATLPKNRVIKLSPDILNEDGAWEAASNRLVEEGKSFYRLWVVHYAGVDELGSAMYVAKRNQLGDDGEPIVDHYIPATTPDGEDTPVYKTEEYLTTDYVTARSTNRKTTKDIMPDVYGGFGINFDFYGFDLSVGLSYQLGGKIYDTGYASYMNPGLTSNLGKTWHKDMLKSWTYENTNTDVPRMGNDGALVEYASSYSDRFIISSDYLSLNNITLGYSIPEKCVKKLGLSSLRLYFAAENVAMISARRGLDPRQSFISSNNLTYSPIRTLTGGLRIGF